MGGRVATTGGSKKTIAVEEGSTRKSGIEDEEEDREKKKEKEKMRKEKERKSHLPRALRPAPWNVRPKLTFLSFFTYRPTDPFNSTPFRFARYLFLT